MKLCYNEACAMQQSTLENDLQLCEKSGFDFIEIRLDMLAEYLRTHTVADLKTFFDTHHLKPHCINQIYLHDDFLSNRDDPEKSRALLERFMFTVFIANEIGAPGMVVVSSFTDDGTKYGKEWLLKHFAEKPDAENNAQSATNFSTEAADTAELAETAMQNAVVTAKLAEKPDAENNAQSVENFSTEAADTAELAETAMQNAVVTADSCLSSDKINLETAGFAEILAAYNNFDTENDIRAYAVDNHVRILKRLDGLCTPYGIKLALELVGMEKAAIGDIDIAKEVVERVNSENVGYAMDIANIFIKNNDENDFEKLRNVDAKQIFAFHVNNADNAHMKIQSQRTLPDRGVVDAEKIIRILREIGYDGMLSAETFRPEYFVWEPEKVIAEAAKSILSIAEE